MLMVESRWSTFQMFTTEFFQLLCFKILKYNLLEENMLRKEKHFWFIFNFHLFALLGTCNWPTAWLPLAFLENLICQHLLPIFSLLQDVGRLDFSKLLVFLCGFCLLSALKFKTSLGTPFNSLNIILFSTYNAF